MLPPVAITAVNDTCSVLLIFRLLRDFLLVAVTTVLHDPVANSSQTGSGPRPGGCWRKACTQ